MKTQTALKILSILAEITLKLSIIALKIGVWVVVLGFTVLSHQTTKKHRTGSIKEPCKLSRTAKTSHHRVVFKTADNKGTQHGFIKHNKR